MKQTKESGNGRSGRKLSLDPNGSNPSGWSFALIAPRSHTRGNAKLEKATKIRSERDRNVHEGGGKPILGGNASGTAPSAPVQIGAFSLWTRGRTTL
jgi:hypothetical protein